jgi:hypothetical protein
MTLAPQIEGAVPVRSSASRFVAAFRQRVAAGLLSGRPHPRSNYRVVEENAGLLRVCAADYWTAINVGLNDLELRVPSTGMVQFRVLYWRWAYYALGVSGVLGFVGLFVLLTFDVRSYIAREPSAGMPGLSTDQNLALAWVMVLFWGFAWPWVLITLHKRPLRRLVERLVREVDAQAISH